jgi:anthranilate phosphoribosyltransferase
MNAAAGLIAAGAARDYLEASDMARESIISGKAREKLTALIMLSQTLK